MSWSESSVFQGMSGMAGFAEACVRASAPPHPLCVSLPPLLSLVSLLVVEVPWVTVSFSKELDALGL